MAGGRAVKGFPLKADQSMTDNSRHSESKNYIFPENFLTAAKLS
jgi:hypothetical protein